MGQKNFYFGGGAAETTMHPIAMVILVVAIIFIFFLPRKYVIIPVLLGALLVPLGQVYVVAGIHLQPPRVICLFGWVRLMMMKATSSDGLFEGRWNSVDRLFFWWGIVNALAVVVLWKESAALVNQFGFLWTAFGMYFLLRVLIRDEEDIVRVAKVLVLVVLVNAAEMVFEQVRLQNVFGIVLGGGFQVPQIREGRIRSQGAFETSISAGTFGATLIGLFLWLWASKKGTLAAWLGLCGSAVMAYTSGSSTPMLASVATAFAICMWPLRNFMRAVRWALVVTLICLHMVMKAAVWMLIGRVDLIGGSSGSHRAYLIDTFLRHFTDWWFAGTKDAFTWGIDMWDLSNQFVAVGETGGLLALMLFIFMIARSFGRVGKARKAIEDDRREEWMMWFLGVSLFSYVVGFFGENLLDQSLVEWFIVLAVISAATAAKIEPAAVESPEPEMEMSSGSEGVLVTT